ncbi:antenna complex alpha/beta subunit [Thiorhodococcus drewsii AZ1]|uniref:Antenna complex alpha/beta subunit n=1 Tax=Thiorhodococcus drewsii AZ1 TaxID=765913 RepID=G2DXJ0_9GAMM|nr:antenna complex alpha/beta subunit [Thiorhodococcus drewsii AZ1]
MADKRIPAAPKGGVTSKPRMETEQMSLSGLTDQQAKEFHEQFKVTYTAFVGLAALAHLFVLAANPWF